MYSSTSQKSIVFHQGGVIKRNSPHNMAILVGVCGSCSLDFYCCCLFSTINSQHI